MSHVPLPCVSCERPNASPSVQMPAMCSRCWLHLPQLTRELYLHGGLDGGQKRLTAIAKERNASVRTFGGGTR